jgi:hypothetical protein
MACSAMPGTRYSNTPVMAPRKMPSAAEYDSTRPGFAACLKMMMSESTRPTSRPPIIGMNGLMAPLSTAIAVMTPATRATPRVNAVLVTTSSTVMGRSPVVGGAW